MQSRITAKISLLLGENRTLPVPAVAEDEPGIVGTVTAFGTHLHTIGMERVGGGGGAPAPATPRAVA